MVQRRPKPIAVCPTGRRRVVAGVLLALALAACSGDGESAGTTTTERPTASSSTTETTVLDDVAAAQVALDSYWAMVKRVGSQPNPDDPELGERAVDPILSSIRDLFATQQAQGQRSEYDGVPYRIELTIVGVEGDTATFEGCAVNGARLIGRGGEVVNDDVNTYRQRGTLIRVAGIWKMQRFDVLRQAAGEVPCESLV